MNQKKFDASSYGLINKNELSVTLHLWKGARGPTPPSKIKPIASPELHRISLEKKEPLNPKVISASLEFTNVSSRELHIEDRFWFLRLKVLANNKPMSYIGPVVSLPPPNKNDFVTLKPGEKFATEPTNLNNYFGLPDDFKGVLKASFQFTNEVPMSEATLTVEP